MISAKGEDFAWTVLDRFVSKSLDGHLASAVGAHKYVQGRRSQPFSVTLYYRSIFFEYCPLVVLGAWGRDKASPHHTRLLLLQFSVHQQT